VRRRDTCILRPTYCQAERSQSEPLHLGAANLHFGASLRGSSRHEGSGLEMDMRWGVPALRVAIAHGSPKRRIFSAGTGLRSMSYPHGSPRGGLTSSCWRCRRDIPVVAFLMLLQLNRSTREGDHGNCSEERRRRLPGSASAARFLLPWRRSFSRVRPGRTTSDLPQSGPPLQRRPVLSPCPPCDGPGPVSEQARETVYAQDRGWRHDAPRGRWGMLPQFSTLKKVSE
jgi:hypothetical protein